MQQQMPKLLWISIISLGIMTFLNLSSGLYQMNFFFTSIGVIDGTLIWGIIKGYRWTFWTIVILVFGGLFYITLVGDVGPIVLSAVFDSFLFIPVLLHRKYFFQAG